MPDCPFDPVQVERLRELAVAATKGAWPRTSPSAFLRDADAAFIAACDPQTILGLLDLLAGQAEQIEQLGISRAGLEVELEAAKANAERARLAAKEITRSQMREMDAAATRAAEAVRQRDNLRDALREHWFAEVLPTLDYEDESGRWAWRMHEWFPLLELTNDECIAALRAAAVGEGGQDA